MKARTTRRTFLGFVGIGGAALLAACGQQAPAAPTSAPAGQSGQPAATAPTSASAGQPAAGGNSVPAAQPATSSGQPVHILIHFSDAGNYGPFVTKYTADVISKKLPNYQIEVQGSPSHEENFTKMLALYAAGRAGDMGYIYPAQGWLGSFSAKGMFVDHGDLAKKDNYDLKQFFDGAIKFSTVDGVLRALPWHAHAEHWTWFLNLDAFKEAGVKPPPMEPPYEWNITDETDMLTKLVKRNGDKVERYGIISEPDYIGMFMAVRAFGSDFLSDDGKSVRLGEKPGRAAIKWLYDRIYTHKVAPTSAQMEGNEQQMFIGGKLAVLYAAGSAGPTMQKAIGDKFKMGVVAGPIGPAPDGRKAAAVGPNCVGLMSSSKNRDAAWEVLKLEVSQDAGVQKVLQGAGAPGGRPDCYDDPKVIEAFPGAKVIKYQLGFGWPENLPWNLRGREMTNAVEQTLANVWLNKMTPDQGVDATVKAMEDVLKLTDVRQEK